MRSGTRILRVIEVKALGRDARATAAHTVALWICLFSRWMRRRTALSCA